jgi:Rps23 Pro-64 3,4-dihydroxylase Tpa1-like proline 4-hydroxylase
MQIVNSTINLTKLAKENQATYQSADPFPCIFFDDFFDLEFLTNINQEFSNLDTLAEDKYSDANQLHKQTLSSYEKMDRYSQQLIDFLHSAPFLKFLQVLTGIEEPLIPDPMLEGGGYHETKTGGFLKLHVDFNKHYRTKLDRRINLLVFLNPNWEESYGGEIELWNETLTKKEFSALPIFNRIVLFNTTSSSFHGQPNPITCPENITRKSIALYYYSHGRPSHEIIEGMEEHSTLFKGRTEDEIIAASIALKRYKRKQFLWSLIPPIAFKIRRILLNK